MRLSCRGGRVAGEGWRGGGDSGAGKAERAVELAIIFTSMICVQTAKKRV